MSLSDISREAQLEAEIARLRAGSGIILDPAEAAIPPAFQTPAADPYAVKTWGAKNMRTEIDIECPSGQRCRARTLEVEDAISLGILDTLDIFSSALMKDVAVDPVKQAKVDASAMDGLKDPEKRANFFGTVNKVVSHTVVIPKVVLYDDGNLPEGTIFANDIPFTDKMHIFRNVFSNRGSTIEPFREGQEGRVASVEEESGVPLSTE